MYAVIETAGKQGDVVFIEKLNAEEESTVTFDKVVAVSKEDGLTVGAPYVAGATVSAKVLKNGKAKKITVMTYKPKKSEKKKQGHRHRGVSSLYHDYRHILSSQSAADGCFRFGTCRICR